jgi:hypothetical protein
MRKSGKSASDEVNKEREIKPGKSIFWKLIAAVFQQQTHVNPQW